MSRPQNLLGEVIGLLVVLSAGCVTGTGYRRGLPLDSVPLLGKIVAAADVMAALGEDRPHRAPLDDARATKALRSMVEEGALDARAAQSVLEARGAMGGRKRAWPGGLSDREVEVVRLVSVGRTNREIGDLLGMSARTARCLRRGHLEQQEDPMENALKTYVIERPLPGAGKLGPKGLEDLSTKSNSVLRELGPDVQWVHSYVTGDKIYCVYRAMGPEIIREHARCGGFPAQEINLVSAVIDPTTGQIA